ncbi:SDR family oxidoreductase [Dactylococcopsis salina]|uniref:Short-chain alcohol dehydrogenase n=1 Tax=Dactylococcopsis salina (strain PCC 8305) TaxID=13035 RepID=K9YUU6_DACS8|nr:SDR family oxidoreductase [Dactylococcopsis salina]AFZ50676.1 short-chain alcohol dehydrogenase [Dactylococcopsis salina PCC 8305]
MDDSPSRPKALITGASSGIGKETALALAEAGVDLALVGRSQDKLDAVMAAVEKKVNAKSYLIDLAVVETVKDQISAAVKDFGGISILVNNAGMGYTNPLQETPLEDWQQVLNLNLTSVFQCIQGVLPTMRDRASGTIINVASIAAQSPFPSWGAYAVSKAGIITLSKALSGEEKENGIRVVSIIPGAVNTPLWDTDTVKMELNRAAMLDPKVVAQTIAQAALLPQEAVIEEMTLMPSAGAL